jgi:hypothetical protein
LILTGETNESYKARYCRRRTSPESCCTDLRRNARTSMSKKILHPGAFWSSRGAPRAPLFWPAPTDFFKAFVVHARHATFYLFYAKFPNRYLRDITLHGSEYLQNCPTPHTIHICQSEPYRMRYPEQQASFFRLMGKLLYYMVSGYSSIGYLAKDEWNPYYDHKLGRPVPPPPPRPGIRQPHPYSIVADGARSTGRLSISGYCRIGFRMRC